MVKRLLETKSPVHGLIYKTDPKADELRAKQISKFKPPNELLEAPWYCAFLTLHE